MANTLQDDSWIMSPKRTTNSFLDVDSILQCHGCESSFSLVLRKHHCKGCGFIFCGKCSTHRNTQQRRERLCKDCSVNVATRAEKGLKPKGLKRSTKAGVVKSLTLTKHDVQLVQPVPTTITSKQPEPSDTHTCDIKENNFRANGVVQKSPVPTHKDQMIKPVSETIMSKQPGPSSTGSCDNKDNNFGVNGNVAEAPSSVLQISTGSKIVDDDNDDEEDDDDDANEMTGLLRGKSNNVSHYDDDDDDDLEHKGVFCVVPPGVYSILLGITGGRK